jgi:hypothetical protein
MKIKSKNILFFILINFIFFFILEVCFTFFFIYHKSNYHGPLARIFSTSAVTEDQPAIYNIKWNKFSKKMKPGKYKYDGVIEYTVNSLGFIGKEFSIKNKKNCRVISLGGSTTAGLQSGRPYPKILEEKLSQLDVDCEVLNFGFSGKSLNFLENLLVNEAVNYSPNIITIMSNRNSVMYDSYGSSSISPNLISSELDFYLYKLNKFLFSKVLTYRFLELSFKRAISLVQNDENKIVSPYNLRAIHLKNYFTSKYLNQMNNIVSFCKKNNIKVVLVKQGFYPVYTDLSYQKSLEQIPNNQIIEKLLNYHKKSNVTTLRSDQEKLSIDSLTAEQKIIKDLFWIYTNIILNNILDEVKLKNPEIVVVDPTNTLKSEVNNFFKDGLHLTSSGNEVVAESILKSIIESFDFKDFSS